MYLHTPGLFSLYVGLLKLLNYVFRNYTVRKQQRQMYVCTDRSEFFVRILTLFLQYPYTLHAPCLCHHIIPVLSLFPRLCLLLIN